MYAVAFHACMSHIPQKVGKSCCFMVLLSKISLSETHEIDYVFFANLGANNTDGVKYTLR